MRTYYFSMDWSETNKQKPQKTEEKEKLKELKHSRKKSFLKTLILLKIKIQDFSILIK